MHVNISPGNKKMGLIPSVSLPVGITCRENCPCFDKCYARKLERLHPNVRKAYQNNLEILRNDPDTYWREIEAHIMMSRFFRFHVSGDIPNKTYLYKMVMIAERNQHCRILCFTKKYEMVREYLAENGMFPENLKIILSGWKGIVMDNEYNLPEAHCKYKDGTTTARSDAIPCHWSCDYCAVSQIGCWYLENGEQIVFDEH